MAEQRTITARHVAAVLGSAALVFGLASLGVFSALRQRALPRTELLGAVLSNDADPQRQMPVPNVVITASIGSTSAECKSDATGFFRLTIPAQLRAARPMMVHFAHSGFRESTLVVRDAAPLLVARLTPEMEPPRRNHANPGIPVTNVRIRYTVKTESFIDVGAIPQTFEAQNVGGMPCEHKAPCSPDGQWKAGAGGITLDAHAGNYLRNARVSCIAGPCPFTRVESEDLRDNGRLFVVRAISWSDTATFLVEADVVHAQRSDLVRQSYPVIYGNGMSFTLPPGAAGPSLEAEVNSEDIIFPLGPNMILSWADCSAKPDADQSSAFACELKPGYRFE